MCVCVCECMCVERGHVQNLLFPKHNAMVRQRKVMGPIICLCIQI